MVLHDFRSYFIGCALSTLLVANKSSTSIKHLLTQYKLHNAKNKNVCRIFFLSVLWYKKPIPLNSLIASIKKTVLFVNSTQFDIVHFWCIHISTICEFKIFFTFFLQKNIHKILKICILFAGSKFELQTFFCRSLPSILLSLCQTSQRDAFTLFIDFYLFSSNSSSEITSKKVQLVFIQNYSFIANDNFKN